MNKEKILEKIFADEDFKVQNGKYLHYLLERYIVMNISKREHHPDAPRIEDAIVECEFHYVFLLFELIIKELLVIKEQIKEIKNSEELK